LALTPPQRCAHLLPVRGPRLCLWLCAAAFGAPAHAAAPLTDAAAILALSGDAAASHRAVIVTGVVTASESDWEGKFFVQDGTAGVFVLGTDRQPHVGDRVVVTGMTSRGAFAPIVAGARWTNQGPGPLPAAAPTTAGRLLAGVEDGRRVAFAGLVRSAYYVPSRKLAVDVALDGQRVHVFPKLPPEINPESLVGATVRVRGTVAASFNAARHQITAINVYVPALDDFAVETAEARPPFEQPVLPLGEIARYRPDASRGDRLHVRGIVTFFRPGVDLYLQDGSGALHLECAQAIRLTPGDTVEAAGFLNLAAHQPVLEDARCRRVSETPVALPAPAVPFAELRQGLHSGELVQLGGRLVGRTDRPVRRDNPPQAGVRTICTIQNADLTFTTECEHNAENTAFAAVPLGSTVTVTGIAAIDAGDDGQLRTLTLLQRSADDLHVLETPSWFTAQRLVIGFVGLLLVSAAIIGWSATVSKKHAMLTFLVAEREKAQRDLQHAYDSLEQRVRERTEQLKGEMTARKSAELEFKATLTERTRLARELHDTLEQALTGIALQLDTTARLLTRSPAEAERHLELARGFMRQSQLELRRSIWDLRSRELEQFDVAAALLHTSLQLARGTQLHVDVETEGEPQPLPEIVEENLLRIGQEALTNVVKHSGATLATVSLGFTPDTVTLAVKDNGSGLVPEKIADQGDEHFGLLGMAERSKRLGGRFSIVGAQGEGTTISVILPLGVPPNGHAPLS
jgi:signal transduction histidine kinase